MENPLLRYPAQWTYFRKLLTPQEQQIYDRIGWNSRSGSRRSAPRRWAGCSPLCGMTIPNGSSMWI